MNATNLVKVELDHSDEHAAVMAKAAANYNQWRTLLDKYPENTRRAYISDMNDYEQFCFRFGYPTVSPDYEMTKKTMLHYIEDLAQSELKRATIDRRISTLSTVYRIMEMPNPLTVSELFSKEVSLTLKDKYKAQQQARPLRIEELEHINNTFKLNTVKDVRDLMVLNFLFSGLLRGAELARVCHRDISVRDNTLFIPVRKNDQEGKGGYCYLSDKCIELYERWKLESGSRSGFVFRVVKRGGSVQENNIQYRSVYNIVRDVITRCGMDADGYSTHSGRVGSVVSMAEAGISNIDIQLSGGWSDPKMPARYAEQVNTKRTGIAKLMGARG